MVREFYGDVLPETGNYCLTLLPSGQHLWADSLDELVAMTEKNIDRPGLYFGTAAFSSFANRKQSNALGLKSLRLDIDAGPEKLAKHGEDEVYATQREAMAACLEFFRATALPPTYIVSSGAGLHIYYCLTETLTPAAWLALAKGLTALGSEHQLKIDSTVTEDSARILRVPGAPHPNGKRVTVLRHTGVKHDPEVLRVRLGAATPMATRVFDSSINADLDLAYQGPPSSALKVAQNCAALAEVAHARGDVREPLWRAMIGLVKRTTEGLDIAQEWSDGFDGYDPDEVERKYDAWATGPTTCAEFGKHTKACAGCQYQGKIKSPINLGLMTSKEIETLPPEQQGIFDLPPEPEPTGDPWDGHVPAGFSIKTVKDRKTLVQSKVIQIESPSGEKVPTMVDIPITTNVFWLGQWAEAEGSTDTAQIEVHLLTAAGIKRYTMDQTVVASMSELLKFLGGKSVHTTSHKGAAQAMQDYVKAQIQHVYASRKSVKVTDHLGLRTLTDGTLICAHGNHAIYPDGSIRETLLSPALRSVADSFPVPLPQAVGERWEPEVWDTHIMPRAQEHVDFLRKYYAHPGLERLQLALMLVLASPVMAFVTGEYAGGPNLPNNSSLNVSLFSRDTARGKTTAAQSAIVAFGRAGTLVNDSGKAGATVNGRLGRLSMHGTMPNIMDETSDLDAHEVAALISAVANGSGKQTMTQARALRQEATWSLINLVTTNRSQRDMVAAARSAAAPVLYRLLEIDVDGLPEYTAELRASHREDWAYINANCVGALGAVIHREICKEGTAAMARLTAKCVTRAEQLLGATQSARFQSRGLGALLTLVTLLNRVALVPFDLKALVVEFKVAHDANIEYIAENTLPTDPLELLSAALSELAPFTVVTEFEGSSARGSARIDRPLNPRPVDVIKARHIKTQGITYVAVDALKTWCREKGVSDRDLIAAARRAPAILVARSYGNGGGAQTSRSYAPKSLTRGLEGDMNLVCACYTFNVHLLGKLLKQGVPGLDVIDGGLAEPPEEAAAA